jgi:hypothetical protein
MAKKGQQGRVWKLYKRHPYCWWCGCRVRKYPLPDGRMIPGNYATLDHLNSRNMYPGGRPQVNRRTRVLMTVLACYDCNKDRGDAELLGLDWVPPLMATRKISG